MQPNALSDFILKLGKFFDGFQTILTSGTFTTTSTAVVWTIWMTCALLLLMFGIMRWARDHDGKMANLVSQTFEWKLKVTVIGFFMMSAPVICATITGSVSSTLSGLNATVATAGAGVMNSLQQSLQLVWNAQGPVKSNLKDMSPALFDDLDGQDGLADTMAAKATMERLKATAMDQINGQIAQAKALQANPKTKSQGQAMEAQAKDAKRNIDRAMDMANLQATFAQQDASGDSDGPIRSAVKKLLNPLLGGLATLTKFFLVVKSYIGGLVAFIALAAALLLIIMAGFKLMETLVGVFSELARICFFTAIGMAFGACVGPFAIATFFSPKWDKYGHAFVSFLIQVIAGTTVLSVTVKLVAIGLGRFGVMISSSGAAIFANVLSAKTYPEMIMAGILGGLPFVLLGFAMSFFASLISKSSSVGTGIITGTWNP